MNSPPRVMAYVGLGSNLEDPVAQVSTALEELAGLPRSELIARSSLYRTAPVGPQDQPDYINAVAGLATALPAMALLDALQALEQRHGRVRGKLRWGARTLDLDLLLYGGERIRSERLQVPHPRMTERGFVLYPLAEIAPSGLEIPGYGRLRDLLREIREEGIARVE